MQAANESICRKIEESLASTRRILQPNSHAEIVIPQHAGSVLIFTPPGTPRRLSIPCVDSSHVANGHASDHDQPKVESELCLETTPQGFDFGAIELTIASPCVNGEVLDMKREAALQQMNEITDRLIASEEKYLSDLRSLTENYIYQLPNAPPEFSDKKETIFVNAEDIFYFHKVVFLKELSKCRGTPSDIGRVFTQRENELDRYIKYCDGKYDSNNFMESHPTEFFKQHTTYYSSASAAEKSVAITVSHYAEP
ncbi:triple functional domain protein-like [Acropora millepora]|uniref:triple functional domain protein-like n=1 Tax=Acropora millepora TaxID=45264 RepID=UPI001CF31152|nr:triple functional domain protein-like [Acropora millepora]